MFRASTSSSQALPCLLTSARWSSGCLPLHQQPPPQVHSSLVERWDFAFARLLFAGLAGWLNRRQEACCEVPHCKSMALTRYSRRHDVLSAVCLRGNCSLLAGMGVLVGLLWVGDPQHHVPHTTRSRPSRASHQRWSDCGKTANTEVHHAVCVTRLHCSSCSVGARPPLWQVYDTVLRSSRRERTRDD